MKSELMKKLEKAVDESNVRMSKMTREERQELGRIGRLAIDGDFTELMVARLQSNGYGWISKDGCREIIKLLVPFMPYVEAAKRVVEKNINRGAFDVVEMASRAA